MNSCDPRVNPQEQQPIFMSGSMHNEYECAWKTSMHIVFTHTGFQTYGWVQLLGYMIHLHLLYLVKHTCWGKMSTSVIPKS